MNFYDANRSWSYQFLPDIKRIVGRHLLEVSPDPLDWHHATDLLMLDARDMWIAARVRRPGYAKAYPHQFTIRSKLTSDAIIGLSHRSKPALSPYLPSAAICPNGCGGLKAEICLCKDGTFRTLTHPV